MRPPVPHDEEARVRALRSLQVLDSDPEPDFDDIVGLASEICGAPISLISLVDTERQWFKAKIGIGVDGSSRDVSFCAHAIMGRDLMVVPDATVDRRFSDNPAVTADGGVRFYAGAPLVAADGCALGTLCVIDHRPHRLSIDQLRGLRALAKQVSGELELRRLAVTHGAEPVGPLRDVDLAYLVEQRINGLRPIADARNIAITLGAAQLAIINADPTRLGHTVDYVVLTALKAAPPGGRIAVRVAPWAVAPWAVAPSAVAGPQPGSGSPGPPGGATIEVSHAGGTITPGWLAELTAGPAAVDPVPAAVARVLRAHGAVGEVIAEPVGSLGGSFRIRFPSASPP